jgi:hypothetical protein
MDQNKRQAPNQGSQNWQKQTHPEQGEQSGRDKSQSGGFRPPVTGEHHTQDQRRQPGSNRDR